MMNRKIFLCCSILLIFVLTGCVPPVEKVSTTVPSQPSVDVQMELVTPERIEFIFSQPVKPSGSTPSLEISPSISGVEIWEAGYTVLAFEPTEAFGTLEYSVSIKSELFAANHLSPQKATVWKLKFTPSQQQTENTPQNVRRPRVLSHTPGHQQIAERKPEIVLTFNQDMDHDSVISSLQIEPEFQYDTSWEGTNLHIHSDEVLDVGTTYHLILAKEAQNRVGVSMQSDYTWSYTIKPAIHRITWPTSSDRSQPIALHFNYPMDSLQVLSVIKFEPQIPGDFAWDDAKKVLAFLPDQQLPPETEYTIHFEKELLDVEGNHYPTLEDVKFQTPSAVTGASPKNDRLVDPGTEIWIDFDRAMDPVSTEAAFMITPTITGTLAWSENRLSFYPQDGYLEANTDYEIRIAPAAASADGKRVFSETFKRRFSTGNFSKLASFGEDGDNIQVLDADGRRAVRFVLAGNRKSLLTFALYRIPFDDFAQQYAKEIRRQGYWDAETEVETTALEIVKSWQTEFSESGMGYGNAQEVLIPKDVPPGIYLFNMGNKIVSDQLFLVLTHNTVVVKQAGDEVVAWVTDINGESLEGLEVSILGEAGELVAQGRTDESGVYRTQIQNNQKPWLVAARQWDDYTLSGMNHVWQEDRWYWWGWQDESQSFIKRHSAYVFTDRPIYRPGQSVHFKAIIRQDDDAELRLPVWGQPVTLRIRDARDNIVQTFHLETNYYGSVNGTFELAEGAMLGNYAVEVGIGDENFRQLFKVQDYRKPDLKVNIETDAEAYLVGDPITVTIDTEYFFGEPVANARLTIRQYTLGSPYYWYGSNPSQEYIWYDSGIDALQGIADEDGHYTFTIPATMKINYDDFYSDYYDWGSSLQQVRWGLEVSASDGSNQQVSDFAVYQVFNAEEKIQVETQGYFQTVNQPFLVELTVADIFDRPVEGRDVNLSVHRWESEQNEYILEIGAVELVSDVNGKATYQLKIDHSGYYQLEAQSNDPQGNRIEYIDGMYLFDEGANRVGRNHWSSLNVFADKESYLPGDTAQLMIESSFDGPALLSFERGSTRHTQEIRLEAPLTKVEVPIRDDYAPNIFVTINAWLEQDTTLGEDAYSSQPDSRLVSTSIELLVPITDKYLDIQITPDQATYAPRETVSFHIQVTDQNGNPARTELSLALVDEAVFSLSEDLSGSIYDAFYAPRKNLVETYNSMAPSRVLWSGERGGGGDDGGPLANPRSDFPDTAIWLPELRTNAAGEAWVEITLPDTLTTWRLTAKAITAQHQVGETAIHILTQQPIVVQPQLPRILTVDDYVMLSAMVHNYSGETRDLDVSLRADQLAIENPITQTITLAPGEVRMITWPSTALETGEADIIIQALLPDGGGDVVKVSIPVQPLAIPEIRTWVGDFRGELDLAIPWPEYALEDSTVKIELNRSIAGSLLTGLEYLTGFPYGCVEQTMSKALPNAVVGRVFSQLGIDDVAFQAELAPKVNAGLQRLYGYQHDDGGWGWWYDDDTDAYQTAWVVFGLVLTAEAGFEVDSAAIERGANWLTDNLAAMDPKTKAYALYSLAIAGHGNLVDAQSLVENVAELDYFSQFALALSLSEMDDLHSAQQIVDRLIESVQVQDGEAFWPGADQDGSYGRKTMASDTRTTALGLSALLKIHPGHELEGSIVRWLMAQRRHTGWGTTNETSYAILGLTDHLLAEMVSEADTEYLVEINGTEVFSGTLDQVISVVSLEIPAQLMQVGDNELVISQSSDSPLYYTVSSQTLVENSKIGAMGKIQITRQYLDPRTNQPKSQIRVGDLVKVQLIAVFPDGASYIIIEDRLPAGLEALNSELNTSSHASCADRQYGYYDPCMPAYHWKSFGYNNKEIRNDRVSFFITEVQKGTRTITYLARATHEGDFKALPTEAWAMYNLPFWGRSSDDQIEIMPIE